VTNGHVDDEVVSLSTERHPAPFPPLFDRKHSMFRCLLLALCLVCATRVCQATDSPIRFNRDVRSILSDKCFACHGPDAETIEGGLRLDLRDHAVKESQAIVPGDSSASELVRRIFAADELEVMPPPELHKALTPSEKEILRRWIDEGAEYEPHWAYAPMRRPERVDTTTIDTASQVIDTIVAARLAAEAVKPASATDRVTLIRRLSFDLTGMPPTIEEVDQFVEDDSADAYGKLVNRLLESKRYGERMAVYWLDLVRYADTVGYHGDQNISQSPYRDYVINAFNDNMPYDQFTREQLAGDLLPGATLSQRIASGYNRLNQTTEEGGSQAKEYLAIYFADRVRNVSQVFMGATVGCAQCHDHKYDPYTAKDFYSLGAFFADLEERGVYGARSRPPMIYVPDESLQSTLEALDQQIVKEESRVAPLREQLLSTRDSWEAIVREQLDKPSEVEAVWIDDDLEIAGNKDSDWDFVTAKKGQVYSGEKSRRQRSDGLIQHLFQAADTKHTVTPESRFYAWLYLDEKNPPRAVMLQFNDGDWGHRKVWGSDEISYGRTPESSDAYRRAGELPELGKWVRLEVNAAEVGLAKDAKVSGMAFTQFGGLAYWDKAGAILSKGIPDDVANAILIPQQDRSAEQSKAVTEYYLDHADSMVELRDQIETLKVKRKETYESAPQTVVSNAVEPRTIRILPRGNWMDDSGEIVKPAIPEFLGTLSVGDRQATRSDLADWLCRADNPLTARTMVNRLWSLLFGRGICASVDDFGGQGRYPSYPELLDALAIEFVDSGWNVKHMMRTIVMSETYRRASTPSEGLLERDPYNDLFARQERFCIDAEMVRDTALAISGLLVEEVGGESVHPYQPDGYYAQLNFPRRTYAADSGDAQYRRGLYTHWQRTFLHPMLKAFDAPSREECTAKRAKSNTPLQALALLNDPTFVEAARVFAQRIMTEGGSTNEARLLWGYRTAVSRPPSDEVTKELLAIHLKHLEHYRKEFESAKALISSGDAPLNTQLPAEELAAWTSVARVLLNLHETITRY